MSNCLLSNKNILKVFRSKVFACSYERYHLCLLYAPIVSIVVNPNFAHLGVVDAIVTADNNTLVVALRQRRTQQFVADALLA